MVALAGTVESADDRPGVLQAARAGDLGAFDSLMRRHQRLVMMTALRLLGNREDAQDASQEVFLRLYRNLRKVDEGTLTAWLYRVTVNVCHDMGRKRRPAVPMEDAPEPASPDADPQQSAHATERERAVQMSLRALSETERAAVVLRDLEGLSTGEVAAVLGSSEPTVRSQISKARVKMRDYLERYFRRRT